MTTSGSLGLLFPPSLPLILYGVIAQQIGAGQGFTLEDLFWGGLLPGSLMVLLLSGLCIREYQKAGTEVRADRPDTALITSGPYRYTRNPLYLCLTLVQFGVAMYLNNAWILGLTVASVIAISGYAIRREERYLEQLFGQDYRDYRQRVRRWL